MSDVLRIQSLTYRYPDGTPALDGISLTVAKGERLALIGPNGAGKSTLLMHINGLLRGEGTVHVGGTLLTTSTLPEIRRRVGFVFQHPDDQLFLPTVAENVRFGMDSRSADTEVNQVLERVGLAGQGGRNAWHLSHGEKRRAALAMVLAREVDLLVLDEPSTGLDPRGRRELGDLLLGLNLPFVLASHDLAFVRRVATTAMIIDQSREVARGPVNDLLDDEPLLRAHGLA